MASLERKLPESEQEPYISTLEQLLDVQPTVDAIIGEYKLYNEQLRARISTSESSIDNELRILRSIKLFLYEEAETRKELCSNTLLAGSDCLTLAALTCLMANKLGISVKVARPDLISRYLHAVIQRSDGSLFKVSGKKRNYETKVLEPEVICSRLRMYTFIRDCIPA